MIATLGPLMPMMRPEHYEPIVIDMGDQIEQRTLWNWALAEGEQAYVTKYHEQVENRILELADGNPVLMKVRNGEDLTDEDIDALEKAVLDPSLIPGKPRGGTPAHTRPRSAHLLPEINNQPWARTRPGNPHKGRLPDVHDREQQTLFRRPAELHPHD